MIAARQNGMTTTTIGKCVIGIPKQAKLDANWMSVRSDFEWMRWHF
ncbi:hypothetical protein BH10PLA2_BH10PLA2_12300 [soil metagenome]